MDLKRVIGQAADGHGHDHCCEACLAKYHPGGRPVDLVFLTRLAAAGVLLFGASALKAALPAVSVVLYVLSALCAGCDVCVRLVGGLIKRRSVDEALSVVLCVIFLFAGKKPAAGAAVMLFYRVLMQARKAIFVKLGASESEEAVLPMWETILCTALPVTTSVVVLVRGIVSHMSIALLFEHMAAGCLAVSPCAWVLTCSMAICVGVSSAVRHDILLSDRTVLRRIANVKSLVIDKTGVLDSGHFCVIGAESDRLGEEVLLRIAAHASALSQKSYAEAIRSAYRGKIYIDLIQSFQEEDAGITVLVDGVPILLGLAEYLQRQGADPGEAMSDDPSMYLAINGEYAGRILFGDSPKPEAVTTVRELQRRGLSLVMFTDCSMPVSRAFADEIGLSAYYARPISKSALLRDLRSKGSHGRVAFVTRAGHNADCVSDADVAVVCGGEDNSHADVTLPGGDIYKLATLVMLAQRVRAAIGADIALSALSGVWLFWILLVGSASVWLFVVVWMSLCLLCTVISTGAVGLPHTGSEK